MEKIIELLESGDKRSYEDIAMLVAAVKSVYPLCIYVNLTKNEYHMLEYDNFTSKKAKKRGSFDDLVKVGISSLPDLREKETFYNIFNREALLAAYLRGEKEFVLHHKQIGDDGVIHQTETKIIFVKEANTGDICELTLARNIDDETEKMEQRNRLELQEQELQESRDVIEMLCSEYMGMYYVNLFSEEIIVYSANKGIFNRYDEKIRKGGRFFEIYRLFVMQNVHPDDQDAMLRLANPEIIKEKLRKDKSFVMQYRFMAKGEPVYHEMKFVKAGEGEDFAGVVIAFANRDKDIREKQEQNQRLKEMMHSAEEASRAKSEFLFNMSHDIRTPMNAILGFAAMARRHIEDREKVIDWLEKLEVSGEHLLRLINDVLDMARIESGNVVINEKAADIVAMMENVVTMVQSDASSRDINLTLNVVDVENRSVLVDRLRLEQVLLNIVSNAIKYTNHGGKVDLELRGIHSEAPAWASYKIVVEDTGIGMGSYFLKHAFDSFSRERTSTVSGVQGTGLGLAIAKKILTLMGGTIEIESQVGKGTKVTIFISLQKQGETIEEVLENTIELELKLKGKRVLVVEDNELNREIARNILEDAGVLVEEAENGAVAVEKVLKNEAGYYNLVLMDIQMPFVCGYRATQIIRGDNDKAKASVPIIAMTANAFDEDCKRAIAAGMDAHISKPVDIDLMLRMVQEYCR